MIVMKADATKEQIDAVVKEVKKHGLRADVSQGKYRTIIGLIGDESRISFDHIAMLPGVKDAMMIETPYKLVNREYSKYLEKDGQFLHVKAGGIEIGGDEPIFIAGPCAVESKETLFKIAEGIKKAGAQVLRGGIFKPRSSVHSFQGLGSKSQQDAAEALSWLRDAGKQYELATVTEVRGEDQVDIAAEYADMIQIGARNMYNQDLLTKVARKQKPVLFKRHFGAGIEEMLSFAEYIVAEGNKNVILCERGILPIGKGKSYTRYTLDLAAIPVIQKETYLPVISDPSHGSGRRDLIFSMSCASMAAGASGLMIETHTNPAEALVDAQQAVTPDELKGIIEACQKIFQLVSHRRDEKG